MSIATKDGMTAGAGRPVPDRERFAGKALDGEGSDGGITAAAFDICMKITYIERSRRRARTGLSQRPEANLGILS
jgi:hypothetical protein